MTGLGWWHLSDTERNSKHWVNMCMSEVLQTVGTHFSLGENILRTAIYHPVGSEPALKLTSCPPAYNIRISAQTTSAARSYGLSPW